MDKINFMLIDNQSNIPENHISADGKANNSFEYTKTSFWNSSLSSPEINCDFQLMHSDLQEIKELISDIKNLLKDFFTQQSYD